MTEAAISLPSAGTARSRPTAAARVTGERLAVATTATAIAFLPVLVPQGPANIAPVDPLVVLAVVSCLFWAGSCRHLWRFPYALAMAVFVVGGALGALAGPVPGSGLTALIQEGFLVAWCLVVVNLASSPERLRTLLATWAYSSIAWVGVLFVGLATGSTLLTGQVERQGGRTALTLIDPNVSASYYVLSIMIVWASQRPRRRPLRLAAYAALVSALFTTGSNSGAMSLIVAVAVAVAVAVYRRAGVAPAVTVLAAFLLTGYAAASTVNLSAIESRAHESQYTFIREGIGRGEKSVEQRGMLLRESEILVATGGPLGQGPVSTKTRLEARLAPFQKEAHNDYVAALTERGVIGLAGVLLLVASVIRYAGAVATLPARSRYASAVIQPNALVGGVAAALLVGTVYELLHVRHVWALFAIVAATAIWGRK
jgi:O-antigen ligase/polysaccharide polymerase Wzy-like membrane protein